MTLCGVCNRFTVGNLGLSDVGFDLVLAQEAVDQDIDVQLPHSAEEHLPGFLIDAHPARGVFLLKALEARDHFVLVGSRFGFDCD